MRFSLVALAGVLLMLGACSSPTTSGPGTAYQTMTVDQTVTSPSALAWGSSPVTDLSKIRKVTVSLPAGKNIQYVFTDVSSVATDHHSLTGTGASVASSRAVVSRASANPTWPPRLEFLPTVPAQRSSPSRARSAAAILSSIADSTTYTAPTPITSTWPFYGAYHANSSSGIGYQSTPTTLRLRVGPFANRYLNIWVANNCWSSGSSLSPTAPDAQDMQSPRAISLSSTSTAVSINLAMVQALAAKFLKDGTNDVYGWDTSIFGKEWDEPQQFPANGLIDGHGEINIFITNLNPGGFSDGILEGYFDSTNNFPHTYASWTAHSNEMILFALDANALGDGSLDATGQASGTWDITGHYPAQIVSTLAHEFQHMIQFYQKGILARGDGSSAATWINEMCSMLAEDLVSDKLLTPGPRGVPLQSSVYDYTAGATGNKDGRMPLFISWHDSIPLTGWANSSTSYSTLQSYSSAYAFGAWLIRNYGGPALLRRIVQGTETDESAIVNAVNAVNPSASATFASLVQQWGIATLLGSSAESPYKYSAAANGDGSSAGRFDWYITDAKTNSASTFLYSLGSIDLSHYQYSYTEGNASHIANWAWYYTSADSTDPVWAGASSFVYDSAVLGATITKTITLPPNVVLTILAK